MDARSIILNNSAMVKKGLYFTEITVIFLIITTTLGINIQSNNKRKAKDYELNELLFVCSIP